MHHLEIVPFYLPVTDVPDALVLAQVMVLPQGLGTDVLRALSAVRLWGCAGCPWRRCSASGMGPWGTLLGYVLRFHRAQPSQGLDIVVPWAVPFVKTALGSSLLDVIMPRTC